MSGLPPKWYSRIERWFMRNKAWIWIALFLLAFVIWPWFKKSPPLDSVLVEGITRGE